MKAYYLSLAAACLCLLMACSPGNQTTVNEYQHTLVFSPGQEEDIRKALITAEDNTDILLKEGTYSFDKLSLQGPLQKVSFRGEGPEKTIIDFSGQESGGEGFRVDDVNDFVIRDIQIRESAGDLIKVKGGKDISFINVHAIWDGEPEITNGGYAIYPVLCENVLIEKCYARGASDAGIYVGQTINAVVKDNLVEYCVAGIEIENTVTAEVSGNEARHNTGGLLIFDHPSLKYDGKHTRAFDNYIHDNNYRNFAPAANNATGVGNLSPGTGVLVLRTSDVEVFNNRIENNNTMSVGIISYVTVEPTIMETRPDFDPIPRNVFIHDNTITKEDAFPAPAYEHELTQLIIQLHENLNKLDPENHATIQHILYDGVVAGEGNNPSNICIREQPGTTFLNMDVGNNFAQPSMDMSMFNCEITQ